MIVDEQPASKSMVACDVSPLPPMPPPQTAFFGLQKITEPMWLEKMLKNVGKNVYCVRRGGPILFVYHLRLLLQNSITYNGVSG